MAELKSGVFEGKVIHHRRLPTEHGFDYRVFSLCLDLDELAILDQQRGFAVNRFSLLSFHESDHGNGQGQLKQWVQNLLTTTGLPRASSVRLLCYPRILGFGFNPLSVYFCYDEGQNLYAMLYEVTNTFHQRHTYVMPVDGTTVQHQADKLMYVSPFMPMETRYHFAITPPAERVKVAITQTNSEQKKTFFAAFEGGLNKLENGTWLSLFLRYPLMTLKVVGAIHWQAWKLWRKGLPLQPRPVKKQASISWCDQEGVVRCENI